ncbi:hypothetical protein Hanom_Chr09g00790831 [Helianthus anomalus]
MFIITDSTTPPKDSTSPPNLSPTTTTAINHQPRHYLPPPPSSSSATTPITSTNHLASLDSSLPLPKVVDEADDNKSGACIQLSKLRRLYGDHHTVQVGSVVLFGCGSDFWQRFVQGRREGGRN